MNVGGYGKGFTSDRAFKFCAFTDEGAKNALFSSATGEADGFLLVRVGLQRWKSSIDEEIP